MIEKREVALWTHNLVAGLLTTTPTITNLITVNIVIIKTTALIVINLILFTVSITREVVHNLVAGVLTTALVLSLSIFLYATFYHAYMPVEVTSSSSPLSSSSSCTSWSGARGAFTAAVRPVRDEACTLQFSQRNSTSQEEPHVRTGALSIYWVNVTEEYQLKLTTNRLKIKTRH